MGAAASILKRFPCLFVAPALNMIALYDSMNQPKILKFKFWQVMLSGRQ
jgi:hypothetical protein